MPWGEGLAEHKSEVKVRLLGRRNRQIRGRMRTQGDNFVDRSGAIRLHLPWLVIDRNDLAPAEKPALAQETRNPFSDRGSLVTRSLFEHGTERFWTVRELANEADVSLGLASYVVSELERRNLVSVRADGRAKRIQLNNRVALIEQ